jgi:HAD superfamily hydrolase (TIGR01509 family)
MSYKIGARKPEPAAFAAVATALSLEPSSCAFIDDLGPSFDAQ